MKFKSIICTSVLLCASQVYGANFVCPSTFKTISTGFAPEEVLAACGKPESTQTQTTTETKPVELIQWIYTAGQANNVNQYVPKMQITFVDEKVNQISVSDQNLIGNFPCYSSGRIQIGTSASQVQIQCGAPSYVNRIQQGVKRPVKLLVMTYNFGSYRPKMIFTFENNKLIKIETGQLAR